VLKLTKHARERAVERGVSDQEIQLVVDEHEITFADPKGNPCYIRGVRGRRIKVVIAQDDPELVITVIDLDA
jgi:hypothetical protein